jgi:uncharacterized RDD family membrane protein YckC
MREQRAIELVGPEGVPLRFELATVLERALAFSLDLFVILVLGALLIAPALFAGSVVVDAFGITLLLGLFLIRYFYFFAFEVAWRGTTPGKRALELRVVARNGGRLETDAIFARNLMRDLELFLPLLVWVMPESLVGPSPPWLWLPATAWVFALGVLPFLTTERVRVGDLVGGTRVVRVPTRALLGDEARFTPTARGTIGFAARHLAVYGEHELETLATLLRTLDRREVDEDELRIVTNTIARRIEYDGPEPQRHPALFLRAFYIQQRAALERRLILGERKADKHDSGNGE